MAKDWSAALLSVNFRCGGCGHAFEDRPDLVEDAPEQEYHPYRYFANCPHCGAEHQPQASWERALLKAHQHCTGPKTKEGIAAVSANLAGHPTPEETLRTRFNAMKHGLNARTATYFPAKPGRYSFCERCDVEHAWCAQQPACVKQTEIFMLHHAAFDQRNPKVLAQLHGDLQAGLTATLQMCLQEILGAGVIIKTPKVELSRDGVPVTLSYTDNLGQTHVVYDYQSNPLFKPLADLISRLGLSMNDLGMTVKSAEADEEDERGTLKLDAEAKETLSEFGQRMLKATEGARALIAEAQQRTRSDPVLVEFQQQGGGQ